MFDYGYLDTIGAMARLSIRACEASLHTAVFLPCAVCVISRISAPEPREAVASPGMRFGLAEAEAEAVPAFLIDIQIERGAGALDGGGECDGFACGAVTPHPLRDGTGVGAGLSTGLVACFIDALEQGAEGLGVEGALLLLQVRLLEQFQHRVGSIVQETDGGGEAVRSQIVGLGRGARR